MIGVWIQRAVSGSARHEDHGSFASYAGPVYVDARGTCINWGRLAGGRPVPACCGPIRLGFPSVELAGIPATVSNHGARTGPNGS